VPRKKENNTAQQLTDQKTETLAVVTLGNSRLIELAKESKDDAAKPLYLKRV
jgi:hypothetical protein